MTFFTLNAFSQQSIYDISLNDINGNNEDTCIIKLQATEESDTESKPNTSPKADLRQLAQKIADAFKDTASKKNKKIFYRGK